MVAEIAEAPEVLEERSWSAWWADDAPTVFAARERAYGLYRERGDHAGAARMAVWLACDELDFHGAVAVAQGWLARARRLLEPLDPVAEHGWLSFFEGYLAAGGGDTDEALRLAALTAQRGRSLRVSDLEMLGLGLEGRLRVACAEVEHGMRLLDEATVAALEREPVVPIAGAWTCCFLVTACTEVRDFGRAVEWCNRIAEFAQRHGSRYMLAFCRAEYGTVHLWDGRWPAAESMLEASIEDFAQSRPAMVGGPVVGLAELRRRQGRADDAQRLLDGAEPSTAAQLCAARLAADAGERPRAIELAERALRQIPAHRHLDRTPALELLVRCHADCGTLDDARQALRELRAVAERVGTPALRAGADAAEGLVLAAAGQQDRARPLLEDAVDGLARSGGTYACAQARVDLAAALLAAGRPDDACREAAAAYRQLDQLGAAPAAAEASAVLEAAGGARPTLGPAAGDRDAGEPLSPRELEVLRLLAEGLTNREIAGRLVLSEHTVHRHVTNILRKLRLPSRTAAAAHAIRRGMAGPGAA